MKRIYILLFGFVIAFGIIKAQNDTMYIYKNGGVATKIAINKMDSIIFYAATTPGVTTVTDYDGNVYATITIGTQVWMAENLKVTKYRNGDAIPNVKDNSIWQGLTTGARSYYNKDSVANCGIYGALYNYYTIVDSRNVCPTGWHVPTNAEWTVLENYLIANGYNYDGTITGNKIAKALASTTNWSISTNIGAVGNTDYPACRNKTDFTALPGGYRDINGSFSYVGEGGYWWSSTEYSSRAWYRGIGYIYSDVGKTYYNKESGFSIRCIND